MAAERLDSCWGAGVGTLSQLVLTLQKGVPALVSVVPCSSAAIVLDSDGGEVLRMRRMEDSMALGLQGRVGT